MFCYHQNKKLVIVTLGQQSPPFDDDKTYELFKISYGKELEKAPPQIMLSIKYKKSLLLQIDLSI